MKIHKGGRDRGRKKWELDYSKLINMEKGGVGGDYHLNYYSKD